MGEKYDQTISLLDEHLALKKTGNSPFQHKGLAASLEEVVSNSKDEQDKSVLENMVFDRVKTLKASVNALLEEIGLRTDLNERQFGEIDGEILRLKNRLLQYESLEYQVLDGLDRAKREAKSQAESDVLELKQERRKEELECWRDLMFLKKYLMVSLKDYWELVRRWRVLKG